jgi:hypothetical protein
MENNGKVVALGAGAAVLGHPAASVAMRANFFGECGEENRRLKKMYAEERLKAEIIAEAMQKKW